MNSVLEAVRQMALMKNGGDENDLHLQTLEVLIKCFRLKNPDSKKSYIELIF